MRWTSKLICRDLKRLAAKCTNRFRSLLSNTTDAPDHIVRTGNEDTPYATPPHTEVGIDPPIDAVALPDTSHLRAVSSSSSSTSSDSDSTLPTEVSRASLKGPVKLYSFLSQKLKDLYASRERDLPHMERWVFRGAWLILHMATQYCASNPAHDVLNSGSSCSNVTALLLEVIRRFLSFSTYQLLTSLGEYSTSNLVEPSTSRVSQMPTMPFTQSKASRRHDSVYDTISMKHLRNPTSALLWYTVFLGATDRTKTIQTAEYLLEHVWPENDANAMLEIVGNPAKQLLEDNNTELRKRLGSLLCPEYYALC